MYGTMDFLFSTANMLQFMSTMETCIGCTMILYLTV